MHRGALGVEKKRAQRLQGRQYLVWGAAQGSGISHNATMSVLAARQMCEVYMCNMSL